MPSFLVIQGVSALGWFCLGLAAVKSGMIDDAGHPLWRRARRWCLGPGVVLGLVGAALWQWGPPVPGVVLTIVAAPVATLGYLGLIAALSRPPGPIMARALNAGGSSLSIYLGQSIILSTIFSGYGLGLWGAVDRFDRRCHRARRDVRSDWGADDLACPLRARPFRMGLAADQLCAMVPPTWRTISAMTGSPNPIPMFPFVVKCGSHSRDLTSGLMPVPVSRTLKRA
jgi:hypothetical protein